jgi:hypothetical protein
MARMDLVTYDPPLPDLPRLGGLDLAPPASVPFDWAAHVIRLARAVAERGHRHGSKGADAPPSP